MNKVRIFFRDGHVFVIPAYVEQSFYLFAGMESLTLFVPDTDDVSRLMTDDEHMHFCVWNSYVAPDGTPYIDVTIDFLSRVASISIINDRQSWYESQERAFE